MKAKLARILHKWADCLEPPVKASPQTVALHIDVDARGCDTEHTERVEQEIRKVIASNIVEDRAGNRYWRRPASSPAKKKPTPKKGKVSK